MGEDKEAQRRFAKQLHQKVNIWTEPNRKELKQWAFAGTGMIQGGLAGDTGHSLAQILAEKFNHNFDAYDDAIDAVYKAGEGGSSAFHHLVDGQHSILGALQAVKGVSPDDSLLREIYEAGEHLVRDLCSVSGINPIFSISQDTFNSIASSVAPLHISKTYLVDALTVNGSEVLGGTLAILAVLLGRKSLGNERMAELGGSLASATVLAGNPLLLPIAAYPLYKCYKSGEISRAQFLYRAGKGALVTGLVYGTSIVIGGPVWVGLAAGLAVAIAVRYGMGRVEKLWKRVWPAYQGIEIQIPTVVRQIIIPAEVERACVEFAVNAGYYDLSRRQFLDEMSERLRGSREDE